MEPDTRKFAILLVMAVIAVPAAGQLLPESAHVNLYFPHLADGGGPNELPWQTVLTFVNPSVTTGANVTVDFSGDDGQPLLLNFGSGASSELTLSIPPKGITVAKSSMGPVAVTGWAVAYADIPVQGIVSFRRFEKGRGTLEVADNATLPTVSYSSYANANLGVAVANIYDTDLPVIVTLNDAQGREVDSAQLVVPAYGHTSFNLSSEFNIDSRFEGSISIDAVTNGPPFFIAWTLNVSDLGLLAALPSGRFAFPHSQQDRIEKVFYTMYDQAIGFSGISGVSPRVTSDALLNAFTRPEGNGFVMEISLATGELIADSESEMAFIIGHEFGHVIQARTGRTIYYSDAEQDADAVGMRLAIGAGYDPYAAAGVFGKMRMASTEGGILGDILGSTRGDPHASFGARMDGIIPVLRKICQSSSDVAKACESYKSLVHPNSPAPLPLRVRPPRNTR